MYMNHGFENCRVTWLSVQHCLGSGSFLLLFSALFPLQNAEGTARSDSRVRSLADCCSWTDNNCATKVSESGLQSRNIIHL